MLRIFLISLFASVAFASSDKCANVREICKPDDNYQKMVTAPGNAEELDDFCVYAIKHFDCLIEVQSECEDDKEAAHVRQSLLVLKHICNKETDLYKNLLLVLPCIKHEMPKEKRDQCFDMYSDTQIKEEFEKILNRAGITDVTSDDECFGDYFFEACSIGANGAICGEVARDVALEIAELRIESSETECADKIKGQLPNIVPEMEVLYLVSKHAIEEKEENTEEKEENTEEKEEITEE